MPLWPLYTEKKENLLLHQKWACNSNFCEPNFQEFRLTSLDPQLFKNIAYVGSFKHFSVQLFFYMYFTTRPRPALTAVSLVQCVTCVVCHCNWKTRELNVSVTFALITAGLGWEQLIPPPSMRESYRTHLILGSEDLFSVYLTQRELRISNYFEKQKKTRNTFFIRVEKSCG